MGERKTKGKTRKVNNKKDWHCLKFLCKGSLDRGANTRLSASTTFQKCGLLLTVRGQGGVSALGLKFGSRTRTQSNTPISI